MLYFTISPILILLLLPTLCCMKCQSAYCVIVTAVWFLWLVFIYVAFVIIYGYTLYFRKDNTCQDNYDTSVAMVFMCIFLILGLGHLLGSVIMICAIPIIFCCMQEMIFGGLGLTQDAAR